MNPKFYEVIREANLARIPTHLNKQGQPSHTHPTGGDWNPFQWLQAVIGELGEYANCRKKFDRGDYPSWKEFHADARFELADTFTYLDILAVQHNVMFTVHTLAGTALPFGPHQTPEKWLALITMHLGRYANVLFAGYENTMKSDIYQQQVEHSLCSAVLSVSNLALTLDINLGEAVVEKFNVISDRIGSPVFILGDGMNDLGVVFKNG